MAIPAMAPVDSGDCEVAAVGVFVVFVGLLVGAKVGEVVVEVGSPSAGKPSPGLS
jgi:hypothetical protein